MKDINKNEVVVEDVLLDIEDYRMGDNEVEDVKNEIKSLEDRMKVLKDGLKFVVDVEGVKKFESEIELKMLEGKYKSVKEVDVDLKKLKGMKEGKNYNFRKGINKGVGKVVYGLIGDGLDNNEIVSRLVEVYGNDSSNINCVRWYRNNMNKMLRGV